MQLLNTTLLLTRNSPVEHHSSVNTPLKTTHLLTHLMNTTLLTPVEHHLSADTPVEYHSSVDTPVELIVLMLTVPVDHTILLTHGSSSVELLFCSYTMLLLFLCSLQVCL